MKTITKTIKVNAMDSDFLKRILSKEPTCEEECFGEDSTFSVTIPFPNGFEIDIKCCGVQYEEDNDTNLPWTEAVLFNKDGGQCCFTEPSDDFFGEWELEYDNVRYIVFVETNTNPSIHENIVEGEDHFVYDVVLCEKPVESGLSLAEIQIMYPMLSSEEAFPIEIEANDHECSAMGFITPESAESLDYMYDDLGLFVANILDDMNNENKSHEYFYYDLCIYLSRNF